jgi:DNA-binding FadR family transcriptional regulator
LTDVLEGEGFRLRRASADDLDFMVGLASHEDVEPFMAAVSAREPEALREAYWRHGEWVDGVLFGLIREDLE